MAARWLLAALAAALPGLAQQYRAFWVDAFRDGFKNEAQVEQLIADAATAHANAIFMQARRRGDSYYLDTLEVPAQDNAYSPRFDALRYLIERAHARGIEVHAWFDPGHPAAQRYLADVITGPIAIYDLDGIHLD